MREVNIILVMGRVCSGKTTFSENLASEIAGRGYPVAVLNSEHVRETFEDSDFSVEGRLNAAIRLNEIAVDLDQEFVIIDMVCPLKESRTLIDPNFVVFMDTVKGGPYEMFEAPPCDLVDVCFKALPVQEDVECVADKILNWL